MNSFLRAYFRALLILLVICISLGVTFAPIALILYATIFTGILKVILVLFWILFILAIAGALDEY